LCPLLLPEQFTPLPETFRLRLNCAANLEWFWVWSCSYQLRYSFFWDVSQRRLVTDVSGRHMGPIFKGQEVQESALRSITEVYCLAAWPFEMGPIGCPETSMISYQSMLRNIPEERRSYLNLGGRLKFYHLSWRFVGSPDQEGNKLRRQKVLSFIYPIYYHNWSYISTIYVYNKTSIKRNILNIKQNTVGSRSC